jgi:Zn-dependent protease
LSTQYFPAADPDLPRASNWVKGVLAALLLFWSVAFHELAYSWVARRYGMNISGITLKELKKICREEWATAKVSEVVVPHDRKWETALEEEAMKVLELMIREDKGRIAVVDWGVLVGMITRNGIARYLQIRREMAGA